MCGNRRVCLSLLEQERCRLLPAVPEIFNIHTSLIELEHQKSIDRLLHFSQSNQSICLSSVADYTCEHQYDSSENHYLTSSFSPASTVSAIKRHELPSLREPSLNTNYSCSYKGPFRFVAVPNDISAVSINRQELTDASDNVQSQSPLITSGSASCTSQQSLDPQSLSDAYRNDSDPRNTEATKSALDSPIIGTTCASCNDYHQPSPSWSSVTNNRKFYCSCYDPSRDSAPLLQGPSSNVILSKEFPHLFNSQYVVEITSHNKSSSPKNAELNVTITSKYSDKCGPMSNQISEGLPSSSPINHPSAPCPTFFPPLSSSPPTTPSLLPCLRIGILVGGEATSSGLNNITVGLYHFLKKFCQAATPYQSLPSKGQEEQPPLSSPSCGLPPVTLFGFLDGPIGLLKEDVILLGDNAVDITLFLNRGGCEGLSYRPLRSLAAHSSQLERAAEILSRMSLDGLVVYADREDLLAVAKLAETVERLRCRTRIVAVPHGVGGDLFLPEHLPISLGFDTARRIFTELTGNIATDSVSSKKYYHFLRCGSSMLTLEAALQTRPTISIIAEEAHQMNLRLSTVVEKCADIITFRAHTLGKRSGTVLMSDKLVETLPELQVLLDELTYRLACPMYFAPIPIDPLDPQPPPGLTSDSELLFRSLPKSVRLSLLTRRDHDGRPTLPPIHSEVLVAYLVEKELRRRGTFSSSDIGFLYRTHDMNHECHCAMPTDFGYSLAHVAGALIAGGYNGYVACLRDLNEPVKKWKPCGVPLLSFLGVAEAKQHEGNSPSLSYGTNIKRYRIYVPRRTIDLSSFAVKCYQKYRVSWKISCLYRCPGPVQFTRGIIDVHIDDLPFVLRAHYLPPEDFERLVQSPLEAKQIEELEKLSSHKLLKSQRELLGVPDSEIIRKGRRCSITRKTKEQYYPKLPDIFHRVYTLEASDVTARLATNPSLLRAVFPLTHNLRAFEIIPVGLRMRQTGESRFDLTPSKHSSVPQLVGSNSVFAPTSTKSPLELHRTVSLISLCGFIGSSSVVRVPIEGTNSLGYLSATPSYPMTSSMPNNVSVSPEGSTSNDESPKGSPIPSPLCCRSTDTQSEKSSLRFQAHARSGATLTAPPISQLQTLRGIGSAPGGSIDNQTSISKNINTVTEWSSNSFEVTSSPDVIRVIQEEQEGLKTIDPQKLDHLVSQAGNASSLSVDLSRIKVAVCFLGRPAPGAMNVLWGLTTYLAQLKPVGICYGVIGGLEGLMVGNLIEITSELLEVYHNLGGIELLCRTTEHCHSEEDVNECLATVKRFRLHGLVMCGGFATITTSAILAEAFSQRACRTSVVAVPVSIESGLPSIETTLGHDTSVRVFNSVIGSIMAECRSSKSWYFLRVSGRNLSHLCIECALETHPTLVLISEEVEANNMSLVSIANLIADVVEARASKGMMYGVVLLSDSLLDHVPEIRMLFDEINAIFQLVLDNDVKQKILTIPNHATDSNPEITRSRRPGRYWPRTEEGLSLLCSRLTPWSAALFSSLPRKIQWQFAFSKDYTDKVDLGNIDTEVLLKTIVQTELSRRKSLGSFRKGASFNCKTHFLAYQGRSALPTAFDCDLGFSLGYSTGVLIDGGKSGYLVRLSNLHLSVQQWTAEAIPLTSLIDIKPACSPSLPHPHQQRQALSPPENNSDLHFSLYVPVLRCSLESEAYQLIQANKLSWMFSDCFCNPGPVQFNDATEKQRLCSLRLSPGTNPLNPTSQLKEISRLCSEIKLLSGRHAYSPVATAAATSLKGLLDVLKTLVESRTSKKTVVRTSDVTKTTKGTQSTIRMKFVPPKLTESSEDLSIIY